MWRQELKNYEEELQESKHWELGKAEIVISVWNI